MGAHAVATIVHRQGGGHLECEDTILLLTFDTGGQVMAHTVFIELNTLTARAAAGGITGEPSVKLKHLTDQAMEFAFMTAGVVAEVAGWVTGRVVIKEASDSAVLLLDTTLVVTGEATATRYKASWPAAECDSPALRALLKGRTEARACWCEIKWAATSGTHGVAFGIQIAPTFNQPDDAAPDPVASSTEDWLALRALLFTREQSLTSEQKTQALTNLGLMPSEDGTITWPTGHTIILNAPPP